MSMSMWFYYNFFSAEAENDRDFYVKMVNNAKQTAFACDLWGISGATGEKDRFI